MNILLKDIDIITGDKNTRVIKNGCVGTSGGRIAFVSRNGQEPEGFKADRVIAGKNRLLMPGMVNAHTHCAMTLLRNYANDLALEEWLFGRIFPAEAKLTDDDVYWGTMLGIAEMVRSGTTAFADMYLNMDAVAQAVDEAGMRANLSRSPLKFVSEEKSSIIDESSEFRRYYRDWNNKSSGRVKVYLEVHSVYLFNREQLREAAVLAAETGTGIHIHLLETEKERKESIERYGTDAVEVALETGIFDVPVIAAHCVHLSGENMRVLKEKGVNVAHNPTSNLKLGSGIANVPEMLGHGINVALGTDGTASNNNLNMFEEMHLASLIHKGAARNPTLVKADEAFAMATANGSAAIGFGGETGIIKAGMKADMVIIDTDKPHLFPVNDPVSAIVYSAQGADVETVIVDGNIVMENRELKTIDEELVKYKVKEACKKL